MGQNVIFCQNGNFVAFLALKVPRRHEPDSKNAWTIKFQVLGPEKLNSAPYKNHYKDIYHGILDKHYKKAPKGVFLALKEPQGTPRSYPAVQINEIM